VAGNFGLARLAVDVYEATVGQVDWDAAASGLSERDPSVPLVSEEMIRDAHQTLVEKHGIDLSKYEVIENWSEQPTSYTPALSGMTLLQACIQNAQREYRHTTHFPPLVLHSERKGVVLVGYVQEDDQTIVIRYDLYSGGWNKSVIKK